MIRKRFIKLMMAKGHSRNTAARMAAGAGRFGISYAELYDKLNAGNPFKIVWESVFPGIASAAASACEVISEYFARCGENLRRSFYE